MFGKKEKKYNITIHFANEIFESFYFDNDVDYVTAKAAFKQLATRIQNKDLEIDNVDNRITNYALVVSAKIHEV